MDPYLRKITNEMDMEPTEVRLDGLSYPSPESLSFTEHRSDRDAHFIHFTILNEDQAQIKQNHTDSTLSCYYAIQTV